MDNGADRRSMETTMRPRRGSIFEALLVESACFKFEEAVDPVERKEAETVIANFRNRPCPYSICNHILSKTQVPSAQFHAIAAIKEAVLREFDSLSKTVLDNLRDQLLTFACNHSRSLPPFIVRQSMHVVGVIVKRGFFQSEDDDGSKESGKP